MALDKNKIIAEATKLVQKGAFDKAIKTYERILAEDPKDVRILLKVGELHQKKGDDHSAAEAFTRVAETYAEQGFFLKAVAVYKQIVKLDPEEVRVNERLAALYQQLGLLSDAMAQFQYMAGWYERQGDVARLTDVLKRMVELDPENIASSIKLGELHVRAGQTGPAQECFRRAAEHLKKNNRADEYLKIAERLASLTPDDLGLTRELAHLYLNKRDTKRALAKLQLCFKANPKDIETLTLLAQAFHDLGQTSKTISVYKELAHVYEESGKQAEARTTWRKVQELAADDEDAAAALGPAVAAAPAPQRPMAPQPAPPRATPQPQVQPPPSPAAVRAPPQGRPATPIGLQGPAPSPDAIPKLLTETDVYVKYGLHDKALDHLRKVLLADPDCPEAHEKARDIHLSGGRTADAAASAARAVRAHVAKGALDRAQEALARVRQIDAGHPELPELSALASGGARGGGADLLEPAGEALPDELALSAASDVGEEIVDDEFAAPAGEEPIELPEEEGEGLQAASDALAEAAALASSESEEVEEEGVEEEAPAPARAAARPPPGPPPGARPPAPGPPPGAGRAPVVTPPPPAAAFPDLADELEEAEFLAQQGLADDAREALEALLAQHPGHPELKARLDALGPEKPAPPRGTPAPALTPAPRSVGTPRPSPSLVTATGDESFDIARELAEELDGAPAEAPAEEDFQYSVEDVFNQFKKGVAETVRPEDSATHYDLGIAYKEMGLLDDAVGEFETAMRDRKREVDCLSMIGLVRVAQGRPRDAIPIFRRALGSDHLGKDAAKAIHFDLADAYEQSGDAEAALFVFQKIAKVDASYREVAERIAALGGGPGRPPRDERPTSVPRTSTSPGTARPAAPASTAGKKNIGYL